MKTTSRSRSTPVAEAVAATQTGQAEDPVLQAIEQSRQEYLRHRGEDDRLQAEVERLRDELAHADEVRSQMLAEMEQARTRLERLQRQLNAHKERAHLLATLLKSLHRSLFSGNLFDLLLKACLQITGATRGVYLTTLGERYRARAAVEVDGYPEKPVSAYFRALSEKVLASSDTLIANQPARLSDIPQPEDGELFRNLVVAPVVLMKDFNGIIILADKAGGDFDEEDAEMVLSIGDQAAVAAENQKLQHDLTSAYFNIVGVLADAVETKDSYTHGHCEMVARLSRLTAERLRMSKVGCAVAFYGGLLHDVGKIGVSDGVLNKPGRLTPEEWDLMRSHVRMGRDLLNRVPLLNQVAEIVLHHHERFDGAGYPNGLKQDEIPLTARIVCAVDAYCAMISKRSYKESLEEAKARAELARCKGTHFDPAVVDALLEVLDEPESREGDPADWEPALGLEHPADFRYMLDAFHAKPA